MSGDDDDGDKEAVCCFLRKGATLVRCRFNSHQRKLLRLVLLEEETSRAAEIKIKFSFINTWRTNAM